MKFISLMFLIVVVFFAGCSGKEGVSREEIKESGVKTPPLVSSGTEALFCFGCHSHERFLKGARRGFPHERHKSLIHCNGCHEMKMHEFMKTDTTLCNDCHNLGRFTYMGSGLKTLFDHTSHSKRNSCAECHPDVFVMKKGMNRITMADINSGRYCGVCHNGKKAFSSDMCNACHEM